VTVRRFSPARWERGARVEAEWEVAEGWWRGATAARRRYHRLVTHGGLVCVLYRDLPSGRWLLDQILD
jgi:hypothetical protein